MLNIAVIGGSSPTTPIFIEDLARAISKDREETITLRLHGRNEQRLERIVEYSKIKLSEMGSDELPRFDVFGSIELADVLSGASIIVFQVRPGGMRFRGIAESIAMAEGIPGDEGLGPGGLACYLRGRRELDELFAVIARYSPNALVLMMTSPLGLAVERAQSQAGLSCVGVCELAHVTVDRLILKARTQLQLDIESVSVFGLNHASWIYDFTDHSGKNVTEAVLDSGIASEIVGVDADVMRRDRAVPVHYLRQIYHTNRVLTEQRRRARPRGVELANWRARFHALVTRPGKLPCARLEALLSERNVDWYREGLVPSILAFTSDSSAKRILNVYSSIETSRSGAQAVLEVPCRVGSMKATPLSVRPLPSHPHQIFSELLEYELACQQLTDTWEVSDLVDVLMCHPLISCIDSARRLATNISQAVTVDLENSDVSIT